MYARCHRIVDRVEQLLQDEAYHYILKWFLKTKLEVPGLASGLWIWYQNGVLFPNLCSVMIAVDKAVKNGCMQVIKGSHHMGRVNHVLSGDQAGADMERVEEARNDSI